MATPAAILQVMVEANTRSAMTSLNKFNSALERTDRSSATATTRTTALGKATRTAGSHLSSAARYAAGAAAAYVSISQAKAAVTTTQDLAKTTAGLNRNLGLSIKTASQWGAVAKSRDIDTKSLTMSFTTLSRRLVDTAAALKEGGSAADTAYAPFERLGISQQEIVKGSKDLSGFLPVLADGFGDAAGGAERQASAQQLLGRGYQTILPLFSAGAKGLKEQQEWADKYGATLNNKTLKAQMDLVQAQRESKVAVLGLQVSFATFLTPALQRANELFQRLAKIVGSDELTQAEKFKKLGEIIGRWADKAYDAFIGMLPKLVSKIGDKAPEIARAFVQGFLNTDVWGRLAIGAWLFSKFGGMSAVTKVGSSTGKTFGKGFVIGAAVALPLLIPEAFKLGKKLGNALRDGFDDAMDAIHDSLTNATDIDIQDFGGLKAAQQALEATGNAADAQAMLIEKFGITATRASTLVSKAYRDGGKVWTAYESKVKHATASANQDSSKHGSVVKSTVEKVDKSLDAGRGSMDAYANGADKNFGKVADKNRAMAVKVIAGSVSVASSVTGALSTIAENTNEALKGFGVKKIAFSFKTVGDAANPQKHQKGGVIVPGQGNGDKVPALLEPGEVVLNKKAVAAAGGAAKANKINSMIPRFQKGGVAGNMGAMISLVDKYEAASWPYKWGGGHGGFVNATTPVDCSGFVSDVLHAGGLLEGAPMTSGSLMSWGKEATGNEPLVVYANDHHTVMSLNGKTAGTSGSNPGGGAGWIEGGSGASLAPGAMRTMDAIGGVIKELKRVVLDGPVGAMKDFGQGALDKTWKAANAFIQSQMPSGSPGGGDIGEIGKAIKSLPTSLAKYNKTYPSAVYPSSAWSSLYQMPADAIAALAEWAGGGRVPGWTMEQVQEGEGNFRPGSRSTDAGYGLWAMTKPFADSYLGGHSYEDMNNPVLNAQAMARMYPTGWSGGSPWYGDSHVTDYNKHYTGPLLKQTGGIVQMLAGGTGNKGVEKKKGPGVFSSTPGAGAHVYGDVSALWENQQWISWTNVAKRVKALQEAMPLIEESFAEAQTRAGFSTSEAGSETGPTELAQQIFLEAGLVGNLKGQARLIKKGMRGVPKTAPLWKSLNEQLIGLQGFSGTSGRILQEQSTLDGLRGTAASVSGGPNYEAMLSLAQEQLAEANRMNALYRAQMPVFAGAFANGGTLKAGQWGIAGEAGPEIITGPAQVVPTGGSPNVQVNFANGMEWLGDFVEVKVDGVNRKTARVAERRTPTRI